MNPKQRLAALMETFMDRMDEIENRQSRLLGGVTNVRENIHTINNTLSAVVSNVTLDGKEIASLHRKVDAIGKTIHRMDETLKTIEALFKRHTQSTTPPSGIPTVQEIESAPEQEKPTRPGELRTGYHVENPSFGKDKLR